MFDNAKDFEITSLKAMNYFNFLENFEAEYLKNKNELLSEIGDCFKLTILQEINVKKILIEIYLHYQENSNWVNTYFVIKDLEKLNILNIEDFKEHFSSDLFKKIEFDLNRVDYVSNFYYSKNMVYKLNDCGLREKYQKLKNSNLDENVKLNLNEIIQWSSWVGSYFNIFFPVNFF
jgi:hypothetical protein